MKIKLIALNYIKNNHIMSLGKGKEHPFTVPSRIVDGKLLYIKE